MTLSEGTPSLEAEALMATLTGVAPNAPTASADWTVRNILAHFAGGTKEVADLLELKVNHHRQRPTMDSISAKWHSLRWRCRLVRAVAASGDQCRSVAALAAPDDPTFVFTGTTLTLAQFSTPMRTEMRSISWDIVGDHDLSEPLLTQADLSRHAVDVLDSMPG